MKRWMISVLITVSPLMLLFPGAVLGQRGETHGSMMDEKSTSAKEPELENLSDLRAEITALRRRLAALEASKRTITDLMPNFAERFHVMHRAADVGDWAVAAHENEELMRLTRISRDIDPKIGALMQGFMGGNLVKLKETIEHGNLKLFNAALKDTLASCNGCHTATGSTIAVTLDVDESLNMRHPHALRKSTVPKDHKH